MNDGILALVVITALGFDFTNGFHDTGNAMATSIATEALPPKVAVALSGVLNLVGAAITAVTHQPPSDDDLARVAARLAAGGWPLAEPNREELVD